MEIKYPNQKKEFVKPAQLNEISNTKKSRLGFSFEEAINESNEYYLSKGMAVIHKKPTPIQIVSVNYPKRSAAKITEAYFKIPSTTDYNGIYKGMYLDFEAKQTNSDLFPFAHIYEHQITHLEQVERQGGIAFLLIHFNKRDEIYLLDIKLLSKCYQASKHEGRKSINYTYFKENGILIKKGFAPRIRYLEAVDDHYNIRK
jgi:recombination protein U